jgi:heme/copper-type cytochrome/quinol oxidase subunit 1
VHDGKSCLGRRRDYGLPFANMVGVFSWFRTLTDFSCRAFCMQAHIDNPPIVFAIALIVQGCAVYAGDLLRKRSQKFRQGERHDFDTIQAATSTLLALVIGFTFSMAVTRYDQRKRLEEAEANATGTEYLRAHLLPAEVTHLRGSC